MSFVVLMAEPALWNKAQAQTQVNERLNAKDRDRVRILDPDGSCTFVDRLVEGGPTTAQELA